MNPPLPGGVKRAVNGLLLACLLSVARAGGGPGTALHFDDSDDSVTIPHHAALNSYQFTLTAWLKTMQVGDFIGVINKYFASSDNGWNLQLHNGNITAYYFASGASNVFGGGNGLDGGFVSDGDWHHVAFTVDASGGKLYVDGQLQDSRSWTGTPGAATTTQPLSLGVYPGGGGSYSGELDEITIWNVALSQAQIQANKNRSLTGDEAGLVAYYRCDEGSGLLLADSAPAAGNNNGNGTLNGPFFEPSDISPFTPFAQTLAATGASATNATLNGMANPEGTNTSAWFQWGTTTNYGNTTPAQPVGSGVGNVNFNQALAGLFGGVTYHFRAVASNTLGVAFGTNQSFSTPIFANVNAGLPARDHRTVAAWGDMDGDGRLDIVLLNYNTSFHCGVWRNTGSGFTNSISFPFGSAGAVALGDFDNDDRLDVLLPEAPSLLRNTGTGLDHAGLSFFPQSQPLLWKGSGAWNDFDNDGRRDFVHNGQTNTSNTGAVTELWRNRGGGLFTIVESPLPAMAGPAVWIDLSLDQRPDLVMVAGQIAEPYPTLAILNDGIVLTQSVLTLPNVTGGALAVGDYDADGREDLCLTGTTNALLGASQIWRNSPAGLTNINAGLPGTYGGSVAWGDYDNDGRLDVLLSGITNPTMQQATCQVWRNTGAGFTNVNAGLPAVHGGSVAWGDYDNDGRLDILLVGDTNDLNTIGGGICQVWRNNTPVTNTPPSPPTGLAVTANGSVLTFSWNAASDGQTPASGLTYNLRVGTTPGAGDLVGPMSAGNGWRHLPQTGNARSLLSRSIQGLPLGQPIFWSVQAVDTAFAGSAFATEQSFALNVTPTNGIAGGVPGDTTGDGIVDQSELNTVLANYFSTSPWLQMTNVAGLGGTNVTFALTNSFVGAFSVEFTTNLADWLFLGAATPRYLFTDTNAPAVPQRSYRLRWP